MLSAQHASPALSRWLGFPDLSRLPEITAHHVVCDVEMKPRQSPLTKKQLNRIAEQKAVRLARWMLLSDEETLTTVAVKIYGSSRGTNQAARLINGLVNDGLLALKDARTTKHGRIYVKVNK